MAGAKVKLAKLEKVENLRQVWPHESMHFTKWLCEEEGLTLLSTELGIDIVADETESTVGVYRADVLAHEEGTGRRIVIENQLGETDHDHLGKLLVYAAGKAAEIVVWIVRKARDEHRRAVEWLNERTDQGIGFFLVEVELWKIGDSAPAVRFNAVERPNEWAKVQKTSEPSDVKLLQLRFWTAFREYAEGRPEMRGAFSFRKPLSRSYYNIAVGHLSFLISLFVQIRKARIQAALYFQREGRELFAKFRAHEAEIKVTLDTGDIAWTEAEQYDCFSVWRHAELEDESSWPEAFDWLCAMSLRLKQIALKFGRPAQAEPEDASGDPEDALPEGMPGRLHEDDEGEREGGDGDKDVGRDQDPVAAVREDWYELRLVPDEEKTAEMCMGAVRQCGIALRFVPERLKTPELCMVAVKWDEGFLPMNLPRGGALEFVPEALKTPEMCEAAVRRNGRALRWVPEALKTPELCAIALHRNPWALQDVPKALLTPVVCMKAVLAGGPLTAAPERCRTSELFMVAVRKRGWALQFIPETDRTADLCAEAVKRWPPALEFVPDALKTEGMCAEAVRRWPEALRFVPAALASEGLCMPVVEKSGDALEWVPEAARTPVLCRTAVRESGLALRFVPEALKTLDLCSEAVKDAPVALEFVPEALKTEGMCAEAARSAWSLEHIPDALKTPGMCGKAVQDSAQMLEHVPDALKTLEMCVQAVGKAPWMLEFVPDRFKTPEFCMTAVGVEGHDELDCFAPALKFVPDALKTEALCRKAVEADWRALEFVPQVMKTWDFCIVAVRKNGRAFAFVPDGIKTEEVCRDALRTGGSAPMKGFPVRFLTPELCWKEVLKDGSALEFVPDSMKTPELCMLAVENSGYALAFEYVPDRLKTVDMCLEAVRGSGYVAFGQTPPELRSEEMVWINEEGHFRGVRLSGWESRFRGDGLCSGMEEPVAARMAPEALMETILLGLAVGDATGVPFEFMKRGTFKAKPLQGGGGHGQPAGTWSDDTALALAFADALLPGGFDAEKAGRNFQDWLYRGKFTARGNVFDVGGATRDAIGRMRRGVPPEQAGGRGEMDNGNGSLMRIAPIVPALLAVEEPQARYEAVRKASSLTHAHPLACACCFVFTEYLRRLCEGWDRESAYSWLCAEFADEYPFIGAEVRTKLGRVLDGRLTYLPEREIQSGGYVVHTLEAALWCFLESDSYAETVLKAAGLGRDADTTACVAGVAAALCWGRDAIPAAWIDGLAGRDELLRIARKAAVQIRDREQED